MSTLSAARTVVKVKVDRSQSLPSIDDHRLWNVSVRISPDSPPSQQEPLERMKKELQDPFVTHKYENYENYIRSGGTWQPPSSSDLGAASPQDIPTIMLPESSSIESVLRHNLSQDSTSGVNEATDPDTSVSQQSRAISSVEDYRLQLRKSLGLEDWWHPRHIVKISISEDHAPVDQDKLHYCSIHSLLWELLEHDDPDIEPTEKRERPKVQVTRWITGIPDVKKLPAGLCGTYEPISLLLVLARSLRRPTENKFHDAPSVAQDVLYAIQKFLCSRGSNQRLSVDVIRPGSFQELKQHLHDGKRYDMVHFDVHGDVQRKPTDPNMKTDLDASQTDPVLCFAQPEAYTKSPTSNLTLDSQSFSHVGVENVAKLLQEHGITAVALSACLSSYPRGKPLSNMCRVFAKFGVSAVTGMSFTVTNNAASAYYEGFYTALVVSGKNFRCAAVKGRRSLQEQQKKEYLDEWNAFQRKNIFRRSGHQTYDWRDRIWPTATTYFATNDLDRANSMEFGADTFHLDDDDDEVPCSESRHTQSSNSVDYQSLFATVTVLACLSLFKGSLFECYATLVIAILVVCIRQRQMPIEYAGTNLAEFEAFKKNLVGNGIRHSVGLMLLEDRLITLRRLYIQFNQPHQSKHLHALKDVWLTTNFADTVEIMHASEFEWHIFRIISLYLHVVRQLVSRFTSELSACWTPRPSKKRQPRTILIIEGLEAVINGDTEREGNPLSRMNAYIWAMKNRHSSGLYLIMIGSDKVKWSRPSWDVDKYAWTEAQAFVAFPKFGFMYARG